MIKRYLSFSISLIIVYACATVQSPTGGDKDEKAPILYESTPKDQSTNFQGKEIKLYFNEWMKLEQLDKELIITPREDIEYEASLKKQEFTIELKEPLKDSTTYTFNFRKSLKDITEGNLWENPIIAFSTGDFLDSLQVQGQVSTLMTEQPAKSYVVGLYNAKIDTANLRQGKPVYFTTTDEKGFFKMNNLKAGKYLLYAFEDKNNNLINNPQSEAFGFSTDTLNLYDSLAAFSITTYQRNEDTLKLKKYSPVGKDFIVQYNKGLSHYEIKSPKDSSQHIYANDVENSKYLKLYKENFPELAYETDSAQLFIRTTDSINQTRLDTIYFKVRESRLTNNNIQIVSTPNSKLVSGPQSFTYRLSKPVKQVNYDSIQLRIDSIPITTFTNEDLSFSFNKKEVQLHTIIDKAKINGLIDSLKAVSDSIQHYKDSTQQIADSILNNRDTAQSSAKDASLLEKQNRPARNNDQPTNNLTDGSSISTGTSVSRGNTSQRSSSYNLNLYLGKGAFVGIESDSTSKNTIDFTFKTLENYGIIKGNIIGMESDFVIQLLTEKYEMKDTIINKNEYQFNYVDPGKYRIRLIEDKNGNHKWDAGDPLTLTPAEQIFYLDEVITVKANWEILDKNLDFSVDKDVNEGGQNDDL